MVEHPAVVNHQGHQVTQQFTKYFTGDFLKCWKLGTINASCYSGVLVINIFYINWYKDSIFFIEWLSQTLTLALLN